MKTTARLEKRLARVFEEDLAEYVFSMLRAASCIPGITSLKRFQAVDSHIGDCQGWQLEPLVCLAVRHLLKTAFDWAWTLLQILFNAFPLAEFVQDTGL